MMCVDMLVDILRRLPPCSLASSRSVCKAWCAIVDDHRLLRADLLPLPLDGVFYETADLDTPRLFARRSTARKITNGFEYLDGGDSTYLLLYDCCNGLLLLGLTMYDYVVNPATRQWAQFPQPPRACSWPYCIRYRSDLYLLYDPAVSAHYEVLLIPHVSDHEPGTTEWPPSSYIIHVFSSKTRCWKKRPFAREGDAADTVANVRKSAMNWFYSAYWQRAIYVHCDLHAFILRYMYSNHSHLT